MIVGLGCIARDDLLYVDATFAEGKGRIVRRETRFGGNVRTALTAAAALGAHVAYLGVLSDDPQWQMVVDDLADHRVDTSLIEFAPRAHPVLSTITVTADGERFVAFDDDSLADTPLPSGPTLDRALQEASVLLVDAPTLPPGAEAVLAAATERGIPVVIDAERHDPTSARVTELLAMAGHPVLPVVFAQEITGAGRAEDAAALLFGRGHASVVLTDGVRGAYAIDSSTDGVVHMPAFDSVALDTNGCGDVFHGAYAVALGDGRTVLQRVRFASAAAAVVAARRPGEPRVPTWNEVVSLVERSG